MLVLPLEQTPRDATHWSRLSMAERTGLSKSRCPVEIVPEVGGRAWPSPVWARVPMFTVPYMAHGATRLTFGFVIQARRDLEGEAAELRKRCRRFVPSAGHVEHGNGDDLRFSRGQLKIEADYQL